MGVVQASPAYGERDMNGADGTGSDDAAPCGTGSNDAAPCGTGSRDVIIVGSGPAGLTAAIYTARANLAPLVFEGEPSSTSDQPGGQLMLTTDVENYPGFPDGVMGPDLMVNFRAQAERFGAEFVTAKATRVDFSERPFSIWVGDECYRSRTVIVSTGAQSLMLGLPDEERLIGHGVSTCATCDGFFFRGHEIAVVGGGDSALEEAMFLTRFASKVYVVHRRDQLRASKIMQDRALANDRIEFLWNRQVVEIRGDDKLEGVTLIDTQTQERLALDVTGLFIAIGHRPNTELFADWLDRKPNGYLMTDAGSARTNIEGVFACGDVQDDYYRQAVTAAGSGCQAAIDAERWLEAQGH
ncbi:thioredoxin-disulfide reductase [Candidatus Poriferisodalis sp.]|uniref:thioredoxin-disulfide reductase n=1 Tax=Candidatus Poriferisodalis sp. TaxID=3101277 RepID=UPI003B521649